MVAMGCSGLREYLKASINRIKGVALVCAGGVLIGAITPTLAEDKLELFYAWYKDDEGLEVLHPGLVLNKDLAEDTTLGFSYVYETFDKSAGADTVSGASVFVGGGNSIHEIREEIGFTLTHRQRDSVFGMGYYLGDEDDYQSNTLLLSMSQEFLNKNLTLSGNIAVGRDQVDSQNALSGFPKDKDIDRFSLAATQLLSPTSLMVFGGAVEQQSGYLSSPNRQARVLTPIVGGFSEQLRDETHPDERTRRVTFLRGKQYFEIGAALDLGLSYSTDDWGVRAKSAEVKASYYLHPNLLVRYRHRFYRQTAADFYQQTYAPGDEFVSADRRLREFDSRLNGLKFTYYPEYGKRDRYSFSFSYDKYEEDNGGLTADIAQVSIDLPL